jgi:ornithine cyclodeaminase/alanine dehydrogenase-like protein (mu-crystallin family)
MGDLHHAPDAEVRAELADLVVGTVPGRRGEAETWIFDSTGVALQDVASAAAIYERAVAAGAGTPFAFDR